MTIYPREHVLAIGTKERKITSCGIHAATITPTSPHALPDTVPTTRPQEMVAGIDELGNALAFLYSDEDMLCSVRELFAGTVIRNVADALIEKQNGSFDLFAPLLKAFLVSDCLRSVLFALYADNLIKENELDHAYPIVKPLASFYHRHIGGIYKRFENFKRECVFDFLHTHKTDPGPFGGKVRYTKAFYAGKNFSTKEWLALQTENVGLCLSITGETLMREGQQTIQYFELVNYPLLFILSDGKKFSETDLKQDSKEIKQLIDLVHSRKVLINTLRDKLNKPLQVPNFTKKKMLAGKVLDISTWWQQNRSNVPTTSHFHNEWFIGSASSPNVHSHSPSKSIPLAKSTAPSPSVATISIQGHASPETLLNDALDELNGLEGLPSVKKEINNLVSFLKIQKQREEHGLKVSSQALHYVFHGNPGTGKTTVARILAKIFCGFGILKTVNFTEIDRSGLVAGYVGQTAIKTDEVIQNSLDGVLFIDEAYTLSRQEGGQDFGQEAIDTLLKRMEDYRDRLIVIVAGYPALMRQFVLSNPGLSSRFTRSITFDDYTIPEMCRIFATICKREEYVLTKEALACSSILFHIAHRQRDEYFGNARFVRNIYENTTIKQSARLAAEHQVTKQSLATFERADIPFDMVQNFDGSTLDFSRSRWNALCPGCRRELRAKLAVIGRHVKCKECEQAFEFPWWHPILETIDGLPPDV
jgi:Holliday junction resolvasome RuvABC ATP-dependent DNA helicase subunit